MKKLFIIIAIIAGCAKADITCYDINGVFTLTETIENGVTTCVYDSSFYYSYDFNAGMVYVTQYRNGADSFVRTFIADCNQVFGRTEYGFNYGSLTAYGILKK